MNSFLGRITLLGIVAASAFASPAAAADRCAGERPAYAPLKAMLQVCVTDDSTDKYVVTAARVDEGAGYVLGCTLYVKVWHNHSLVVNARRDGRGTCQEWRDAPKWTGPGPGKTPRPGTRVTAQSWFDVRYRVGGMTLVKRFRSPRAELVWGA